MYIWLEVERFHNQRARYGEDVGVEGITKWLESGDVCMLKSRKFQPDQLFCDLLLMSNIIVFAPALSLFLSDKVWIFNFPQGTRATKMSQFTTFSCRKSECEGMFLQCIILCFFLLEYKLDLPIDMVELCSDRIRFFF